MKPKTAAVAAEQLNHRGTQARRNAQWVDILCVFVSRWFHSYFI